MSNMSIVCEAHVTQSPVCSHLRWRVVTSTDEKFAIQMPHHGREWVPQTLSWLFPLIASRNAPR